MKQIVLILSLLFSIQYHCFCQVVKYIDVDIPVREDLEFANSVQNKADSALYDGIVRSYDSYNLSMPYSYSDIASELKNPSLKTVKYRIHFWISEEFKQLHVVGFSRNVISQVVYYQYGNEIILYSEGKSGYSTKPLYTIPLSEYSLFLDSTKLNRLYKIITYLLKVNLTSTSGKEKEPLINYLKYNLEQNNYKIYPDVSLFDEFPNELKYCSLNPNIKIDSIKNFWRHDYTNIRDTVYTNPERSRLFTTLSNMKIQNLFLSFELIPTKNVIDTRFKSPLAFDIKTDFIGLNYVHNNSFDFDFVINENHPTKYNVNYLSNVLWFKIDEVKEVFKNEDLNDFIRLTTRNEFMKKLEH